MGNVVGVQRLDECVVVELPEEIDLSNADPIDLRLCSLLDSGVRGLIVDMSATTFCDSSGVNAVLRAHSRATPLGAWISLVICHAQVRKVFEITGVDTILPIHRSIEDAPRRRHTGCRLHRPTPCR